MLSWTLVALLQLGGSAGVTDSITLAEALGRARLQRGQTAVAAARVSAARGALRVSGAVPHPTVSYSYTESPPRQHLTVDQSLDWLSRRGADRGAARAGIARALADSTQLLADLGRDVRASFYGARAALESEALARAQSVLADSLAKLAAARLSAGDISRFEQEQAVQEYARSRQAMSEARERTRVALVRLARVVGWDRDTPPLPAGLLDASLDRGLPLEAVDPERVPPMRAAIADSAAAVAAARAVSRARIPIPSVQAGAEWDDPSSDGAQAVIGLSIPVPLWNQGGGAVAEASARAAEASARVRETRLEVVGTLREARIHLEETAERARFARDSLLPSARALGARALQAYRSGATDILPALDALRGQREVALATIQALLDYQDAAATWHALLGSTD